MKQASLSDYFSSDSAAVERVGSRSSAAAMSSSPSPNTATDTSTTYTTMPRKQVSSSSSNGGGRKVPPRKRCGQCEPCLKQDCGNCYACRGKKKFGGDGSSRHACVERLCVLIHGPNAVTKARARLDAIPTSLCATGPWTWTQQLRRDTTSRKKETPRSTPLSPPTITAATAATKELNGDDESGSRSWYQHLCNQLESRKFKDSVLRVNSIVYAPFPGEKPTEEDYFWGKVNTVLLKGNSKVSKVYSIKFWDGDITKNISSQYIHRYNEARRLMREGLIGFDPPPDSYGLEMDESMTMKELYKKRCKTCFQCTRSRCGACSSCSKKQYCFQKMCSSFRQDEKAQSCEKVLPAGWRFYFENHEQNPQYHGLFLYNAARSKSYRYRSFENAAAKAFLAFQGLDAGLFYKEVGISTGLMPNPVARKVPKQSTKREQRGQEISEEEAYSNEQESYNTTNNNESCRGAAVVENSIDKDDDPPFPSNQSPRTSTNQSSRTSTALCTGASDASKLDGKPSPTPSLPPNVISGAKTTLHEDIARNDKLRAMDRSNIAASTNKAFSIAVEVGKEHSLTSISMQKSSSPPTVLQREHQQSQDDSSEASQSTPTTPTPLASPQREHQQSQDDSSEKPQSMPTKPTPPTSPQREQQPLQGDSKQEDRNANSSLAFSESLPQSLLTAPTPPTVPRAVYLRKDTKAEYYQVYVPWTDEGLRIKFRTYMDSSKGTHFAGYAKLKNGLPAPAEVACVFKAVQDEVINVDGVNCEGRTFDETLELLRYRKPNETVKVLTMRHSLLNSTETVLIDPPDDSTQDSFDSGGGVTNLLNSATTTSATNENQTMSCCNSKEKEERSATTTTAARVTPQKRKDEDDTEESRCAFINENPPRRQRAPAKRYIPGETCGNIPSLPSELCDTRKKKRSKDDGNCSSINNMEKRQKMELRLRTKKSAQDCSEEGTEPRNNDAGADGDGNNQYGNEYYEVDQILDRRIRTNTAASMGDRSTIEYLVSWKDKITEGSSATKAYKPSWLVAENLDPNSLVEAFRKFPVKGDPDPGSNNESIIANNGGNDSETSSLVSSGSDSVASNERLAFSEDEDDNNSINKVDSESDFDEDDEQQMDPSLREQLRQSEYDKPGTAELLLNRKCYRVGQSYYESDGVVFQSVILSIQCIFPAKRQALCDQFIRIEDTFTVPSGMKGCYVETKEKRTIELSKLKQPCKSFQKCPFKYDGNKKDKQFAYYYDHGKVVHCFPKSRPSSLELFAGVGGMTLGLHNAGFDVKWAVEINPEAAATLRANSREPDMRIYVENVETFISRSKRGLDAYPLPQEVDHIHASPPCKGFSRANRNGGKSDWCNNTLTLQFIKAVQHFKPLTATFENVPGLFSDDYKYYLQGVTASLIGMNYQVRCATLTASHFGDPQNRRRVFLWISRNGCYLPEVPTPTHGKKSDLLPLRSVKDAIGVLEDEKAKSSGSGVIMCQGAAIHNHLCSHVPPTEDDYKLPANKPARTVLCTSRPAVHYKFNRYLTAREAACLQSFPSSYQFYGTVTQQYRQVGNAVPVMLATAVARNVAAVHGLP